MHYMAPRNHVNESVARVPVDAESHYVQPETRSQVIQVTLQRTAVGLGITLTRSKSDVMIAAVATGSPAHRYGRMAFFLCL
jgi:predicted metalloprotease with PDZ domain